jgi:alpha-N-arabinofuranosidase
VGNEIHDITINHQLGGCDTAGIKILGGVDVIIRDNHIYNCAHWGGIWLDWMAQGARVSGNLLHDNSQDLMFEVNHGPHPVDNNLLLSGRHITDASGGGAFVHNLWYGSINIWPDLKVRHTPYFKPHSLEIIDSIDVDQNDDRFYNNVFVGAKGTAAYDGHGIDITARGNVFLNGAVPSKHEVTPVQQADFNPGIKLTKEADGCWWLEMEVAPADGQRDIITTEILGKARIPDARFEQRDGSPYRVDTDYFGQQRAGANPAAGPLQTTNITKVRLKVWPKK